MDDRQKGSSSRGILPFNITQYIHICIIYTFFSFNTMIQHFFGSLFFFPHLPRLVWGGPRLPRLGFASSHLRLHHPVLENGSRLHMISYDPVGQRTSLTRPLDLLGDMIPGCTFDTWLDSSSAFHERLHRCAMRCRVSRIGLGRFSRRSTAFQGAATYR